MVEEISRRRLEDLPCEIIEAILSQLDHVRWLLPALLSCGTFYSAFRHRPSIATSVWRRSVPADVVPWAIAALTTSQPRRWIDYDAWEVVEVLHSDPSRLLRALAAMDFSALLAMSRTHDALESLARQFVTSTISRLHGDGPDSVEALSPSELARIHRAFYRAEIFFNVFRTGRYDVDSIGEREHRFFGWHSPWVNEQLACVHDFLRWKLSSVFHEVAAHNIELGGFSIDWLTRKRESYWKQHVMSNGVCFIKELEEASTFEKKKILLNSTLGSNITSLADALVYATTTSPVRPEQLHKYNEEDTKKLSMSSDECDTDIGPYKAWFGAHRDETHSMFVFLEDFACLRRIGYVMWDHQRLVEGNLLEKFRDLANGGMDGLQLRSENLDDKRGHENPTCIRSLGTRKTPEG